LSDFPLTSQNPQKSTPSGWPGKTPKTSLPQPRKSSEWEKQFNTDVSHLRAPVERAIAHIKSWRILHTDYRRPLRTYLTSFRAAIGLYFFKAAYE
jgi:hypothetical protein